jgi:hypothetical protein
MWDGFFSMLEPFRSILHWPFIDDLAKALDPVTRGSASEEADLYTFRTPEYQLSCAQSYKPGMWAGQQHVWTAILDPEATVYTSYPGGLDGDYMASDWVGGWTPRAGQVENVLVLLYDRPAMPLLDSFLFKSYTHAYFPKSAFDEVTQIGNWTFGRRGDAYIGLYSRVPPAWAPTPPASDYELIANARSNIWIVELGRAADFGGFANFVDDLYAASITVDGMSVAYESPSVGTVAFGWDGNLVVEGNPVDLGPYRRFDNDYCVHEWGANPYLITDGVSRLELDFDRPRRRYFAD